MFCSNCGKKIEDDSKFCEHCGYSIESDTNEVTLIREDEPVPNTETPQKKHEGQSKGIKTFIVIGIVLLILGLLLSSFVKSKSNNSNFSIKKVDGGEKYDGDQFDLLNSTFPVTDEIREVWGDRYNLPTFTLKNCSFETGKTNEPEGVIYEIDKKSIQYADLDGDGTKEVIFQGHYNSKSANGDPSEVVIAKIKGSEIKIVSRVDRAFLNNDFRKYHPASYLWERISFNIRNTKIIFLVDADGCHAQGEYLVTMTYILRENGLELNGRPKMTKYEQQ